MKHRDDLTPIGQSDFDVASGEPDPRGWEVFDSEQQRIGEVDDLIVSSTDQKVEYLDVQVDSEALGIAEAGRHALIPIERTQLDGAGRSVRLSDISSRDIPGMPSSLGDITGAPRDMPDLPERREVDVPERRERDEAHLTRSEEELVVGKSMVEAGDVEVGKHVETEHVRRPVTHMHEEVDIERRPIEGGRAPEGEIGEEEIHIPLREEELVVEKRPRVTEEMIVRKRPVEEKEEIEADVRKEHFYVERHEREGERLRDDRLGEGRLEEESLREENLGEDRVEEDREP